MIDQTQSQPRVSIIMNCYNGEEFLSEAIDSIYSQTFKDWQIIFFDNCSTDHTSSIAREYDHKLKYYYSEKNLSLGEARNIALDLVDTEYVSFLDCDDYYLPNKLQIQIDLMDSENFIMSYGSAKIIDNKGKKIKTSLVQNKSGYIFPQLLQHYEINMQSVMIRDSILKENNLNFPISYEYGPDYDLFMEVASRGDVGVIDEILVATRIHENALSRKTYQRVPIELNETLQRIITRDQSLNDHHSEAINRAFDKITYYKAISFIDLNNLKKAREVLGPIIYKRFSYLVLYLLLLLNLPHKIYLRLLNR